MPRTVAEASRARSSGVLRPASGQRHDGDQQAERGNPQRRIADHQRNDQQDLSATPRHASSNDDDRGGDQQPDRERNGNQARACARSLRAHKLDEPGPCSRRDEDADREHARPHAATSSASRYRRAASRYSRPRTGVILIAAAGTQNSGFRRSASTINSASTRWTFRYQSSTATGRNAIIASATRTRRSARNSRQPSRSTVHAAVNARSEQTG